MIVSKLEKDFDEILIEVSYANPMFILILK